MNIQNMLKLREQYINSMCAYNTEAAHLEAKAKAMRERADSYAKMSDSLESDIMTHPDYADELGHDSIEPETKVFNAMQNGAE